MILNNVTVANNSSGDASAGDGIDFGSGTTYTLKNTIIADNGTRDIDCASSPAINVNFSIIETNPNCTFSGSSSDNSTTDPSLSPLADNGGPTETHAIGTTSSAYDSGDTFMGGTASGACVGTAGNITVDQRGAPRAQGASAGDNDCDIGAFEASSTVPSATDPEPDNHPTSFTATANSASQITTSWTDSTGANLPSGYLVLCNLTGTFTNPVDGTAQANDTDCSDGSGVQNIAQGTGTIAWAGLNSGTQYFFKIFPFSNSGSNIDYKINGTPPTANTTTLKAEPTNHPTSFAATANSSSQITTAWTDSTGGTLPDGYLVLCNLTGTFTNPVDGTPQTNDTDCSDGSGVQNIAQGTGTIAWAGLNSSTQYFFKIFPYSNSDSSIDYKTNGTPPTANATTLKAEPTNHPTGFTATTNSTSQITTAWTDSTGGTLPDNYLVLCNLTGTFANPVDGTAQANDTDCSDGTGVQNITQGTGTVAWTGLNSNTQYFFKIFPFSNSGTSIDYKIDSTPGTANATTLKTEPTNHPTSFTATTNSPSQITTAWTDSTGGTLPDGYLVLCNLTGTFTNPVDGTAQTNDTNCSDGSGVQNIAQGTGTATWTGLNSNTQYFFKIFPYSNSGSSIDYKINGTPPTANATTLKAEPTNHPTGFTATANSSSQITTAWTDSTGGTLPDGYLVLCNLTGTFTDPVDGTAQTNDTDCSDGSGVQNIPHGTGTIAWAGLNSGTQYFFKIFPFSNSDANIDYKTDGTPPMTNATVPLQSADLALSKTVSNAAPNVSDTITYTVVITNNGPDTTTGVIISDPFPSQLTFATSSATSGSYNSSSGVWTVSDAAFTNGEVHTLTLRATLPASAIGQTITNTATLSQTSVTDGVSANNTGTAALTVQSSDLSITKSSSRDNDAGSNGIINYTITVTNNGPNVANDVAVSDPLPANIAGFTWSCTAANGATCPNTSGSGAINETVSLFPANGQLSYLITAALISAEALITNTATVTTATGVGDPAPSNNTAIDISRPSTTSYLPLIFKSFALGSDLVIDSITATASNVTIVIKNQGSVPVVDAFWVDAYLNPTTAPTAVNQRWQDVGSQGLLWGVQGTALPIPVDGTLTLTVGDAFYFGPPDSSFSPPLPTGSTVYAQVDSRNFTPGVLTGGVEETHELLGGTYNNISSTVSTASAADEAPPASESESGSPSDEGVLPPK